MRVVLVGGVPGAGSSTAPASLAGQPDVRVLDADRIRAYVVRRLPRLSDRAHRPLVDGLQPACRVRHTSTRRPRLDDMRRTAAARGRRPRLVLLDVNPRRARA